MTLIKHSYPNPSFVRSFDDLFTRGSFFPTGKLNSGNIPSVNVKETDEAYHIDMAAPGMAKEDFKVTVKEDSLVISSEKKTASEETNEKYTRKEWNYNSFSRSFTLPETVNREGILAEYENGVLKVVLPKMEEVKKNKAIEVTVK